MNLIIKTFLLFYYIPILLANTINVANEYVDNTFSLSSLPECNPGYMEINDLCFHEGDIGIIQKMIDNSYNS